jgi:hypothetical protein
MSCCVAACVSDLSFIFTVPNRGHLVELHDIRTAGVSHPRLIFRYICPPEPQGALVLSAERR